MTNETKKIAYVAKTGGIQFEDTGKDWFNRTEQCKKYTSDYKAGDTVEVGFDKEDGNLITFLKRTTSSAPQSRAPARTGSSAMPKDIEKYANAVSSVMSAAENKLMWEKKDKYIRAQSASKDACTIVAALINKDAIKNGETAKSLIKDIAQYIYDMHDDITREETEPEAQPQEEGIY